MFTRIRSAAQVLSSSSSGEPHEKRDIVFEQAQSAVVSRVSKVIGTIIEALILATLIGTVTFRSIGKFWPSQRAFNTHEVAAVLAALVAILLSHMCNDLQGRFWRSLKISDKIAPSFGRRITESYKILRS
jgi:predicted ABC-type sugar transport system permease subunit